MPTNWLSKHQWFSLSNGCRYFPVKGQVSAMSQASSEYRSLTLTEKEAKEQKG